LNFWEDEDKSIIELNEKVIDAYVHIKANLTTVIGLSSDERDRRQSEVVEKLNHILEELLERFETNL